MLRILFFCWGFLLFSGATLAAQQTRKIVWHNPGETVVRYEGQGWEDIAYNRLPYKAEQTVRQKVWSLSKNTAGLGVRFETEADSILIDYQVENKLAMPHMPATGVSGVDLYLKKGGEWLWCRGKFQFNDTVRYTYHVDSLSDRIQGFELYFPLYNTIKTLKIGVPQGSSLKFLPARNKKPIVVYGTSIAQGACASRPGMAWTNILSRKLNHPVVNLGFSGNGRLEPEVIDLISEIEASVFILDCLPNLSPNETNTKGEIQQRIRHSVSSLREKHPQTPILIVQHAGYSDGLVDSRRKTVYDTLNSWMIESFENLKKDGFKELFMLTKNEIGLSNEAFVDGTHPTDLGMEQYAAAYEKVLKPLMENTD